MIISHKNIGVQDKTSLISLSLVFIDHKDTNTVTLLPAFVLMIAVEMRMPKIYFS